MQNKQLGFHEIDMYPLLIRLGALYMLLFPLPTKLNVIISPIHC